MPRSASSRHRRGGGLKSYKGLNPRESLALDYVEGRNRSPIARKAYQGELRKVRRREESDEVKAEREWYVRFEDQSWGYVQAPTKADAKVAAHETWPKHSRLEHVERK